MTTLLRAWLVCAGLALIACEPTAPAETPVAAAPEPAAADSLVDELPPESQERIAPELPAAPPEPEKPAAPPPAEATRPAAAPTAGAAAVAAAEATAEKPEHPPLDILLKPPQSAGAPESSEIDLRPGGAFPGSGSSDPGVLDRVRDHVRVERHSELLGPTGPRQSTVSETEAALRIPVDESVSLEGGVRVDSREDPGAKEPVRKSTPRVGVEVKF